MVKRMKQKRMPARNGFVDIQKFLYSWLIVILHFYIYTREHFGGGGHAVEFFLISSGAFFYAGYKRKTASLDADRLNLFPVSYIKKRFLRFLPYTLPAFILGFFVSSVVAKNGIGFNGAAKIVNSFVSHIWDMFLISMCGLNGGKGMINGVTWTLSAMLIVEFLILNILVRDEKGFIRFYAPIAVMIALGMWKNIENADNSLWMYFTTFGVIRAFISTCVGMYAYMAAQWLSKKELTFTAQVILTIIELSVNVFAVLSMAYRSARAYRLFCILLFGVSIAISLSNQSLTAQWFNRNSKRVTGFLGEWSMTIYVTHVPIRDFFYKYFESPYDFYSTKYLYGIVVAITSIAFLYFGRWINHVSPKVALAMKKTFIADEVIVS